MFADWYISQTGFDRKYDLDKDLLVKGNKHYSPDNCVLLPSHINILLNGGGKGGGDLPRGVCKYLDTGRFIARHRVKKLGVFDTPEEAFAVYKKDKEVANQYKDQIDLRAYEAFMNYEVNIDD